MTLLFGLLRLVSLLPDRVWYMLSNFLYFLAKRFYRRKIVLENLRSVLPEKNEKEIELIANGFYKNFCDLIVELIMTLSISRSKMKKRSVMINPELFEDHSSLNKEVLVYSIHYGNWEWLALGMSVNSDFPCSPIVHVQTSGFADQYMRAVRAKFGGQGIPKKSAPRFILKNKDKKINIGILADQSPPQNQPKHWVNFLGRETAFINGLTQLPVLTQLPCYFARYKRVRRGHYQIELVKIGDPPYTKEDIGVLRNYIKESEKLIREDPSQYLWSHKRWKYPRPENEELIKL